MHWKLVYCVDYLRRRQNSFVIIGMINHLIIRNSNYKLCFLNKWIKGWMGEYNVNLKMPSKRYQIRHTGKNIFSNALRMYGYFKNFSFAISLLTHQSSIVIRCHYIKTRVFHIKFLTWKGYKTYVKKNYSFYGRIAALTQVSSDLNVVVRPEFVFKGRGT